MPRSKNGPMTGCQPRVLENALSLLTHTASSACGPITATTRKPTPPAQETGP